VITLGISLLLAINSRVCNCLDAVFMLGAEANRVWNLDISLSLSLSLSLYPSRYRYPYKEQPATT